MKNMTARCFMAGCFMAGCFMAGCFPAVKTPAELAAVSRCDPAYIASWQGSVIEYREQDEYAPEAADVMARKWGDCKGYGQIAQETLTICGAEAYNVLLTPEPRGRGGAAHIITVFTFPDGRRGFINGGQSHIIYPGVEAPSWAEIIESVSGGPWSVDFVKRE